MMQSDAVRAPVVAILLSIAVGGLLAVACAASASVSPGPRKTSNRELRAEKFGRVVDADTGRGIPDVKIIVNWRTSSTGIPGYSSTGGTWCDLQKIVATDADGNYMIPDVSKELDISDRGTRIGPTAFGVASVTHDADYVLTLFKTGYLRVSDVQILQDLKTGARKNLFDWPSVPDVDFQPGKVVIKPIAMRKMDLTPPEQWSYYSLVSTSGMCSDRMANTIERPEFSEIRATMRGIVRPMVCAMPADSVVSPEAFNAFRYLSNTPSTELKFYNRVKVLQELPLSTRGYDPTERISTTAGILCRAVKEEAESK